MIFSKKNLVCIFGITILYLIVATYLMNLSLLASTIGGNFPLEYKLKISVILLQGMWTSMTPLSIVTLTLTGLLTGINIVFLVIKIKSFGNLRNTHIVVGGSSLLGIVGSGCVSCGLPVIFLLGLSGSVMYLPFQGKELSILALFLLAFSLVILIRNSKKNAGVCRVQKSILVTSY